MEGLGFRIASFISYAGGLGILGLGFWSWGLQKISVRGPRSDGLADHSNGSSS